MSIIICLVNIIESNFFCIMNSKIVESRLTTKQSQMWWKHVLYWRLILLVGEQRVISSFVNCMLGLIFMDEICINVNNEVDLVLFIMFVLVIFYLINNRILNSWNFVLIFQCQLLRLTKIKFSFGVFFPLCNCVSWLVHEFGDRCGQCFIHISIQKLFTVSVRQYFFMMQFRGS